jgi:hypothetical protein
MCKSCWSSGKTRPTRNRPPAAVAMIVVTAISAILVLADDRCDPIDSVTFNPSYGESPTIRLSLRPSSSARGRASRSSVLLSHSGAARPLHRLFPRTACPVPPQPMRAHARGRSSLERTPLKSCDRRCGLTGLPPLSLRWYRSCSVTSEQARGRDGSEYVAAAKQRVRDGASRAATTRRKILLELLPELASSCHSRRSRELPVTAAPSGCGCGPHQLGWYRG